MGVTNSDVHRPALKKIIQDLQSGYHHLELDEDSKKKTIFQLWFPKRKRLYLVVASGLEHHY